MPRIPTFPSLYDEALQIDLSKLKEWGYLEPGHYRNGTITWSRNGSKVGNISIRVDTHNFHHPFVELDYKCGGAPRYYKIHLVSIPSNLGNGKVWYFLCPRTNKRCRKLYSIGGYFLHREAFKGCMYISQTRSKEYRRLDKTLGAYYRIDDLYEELHQKYFKRTYAGRPTKRFEKLINKINHEESTLLSLTQRESLL